MQKWLWALYENIFPPQMGRLAHCLGLGAHCLGPGENDGLMGGPTTPGWTPGATSVGNGFPCLILVPQVWETHSHACFWCHKHGKSDFLPSLGFLGCFPPVRIVDPNTSPTSRTLDISDTLRSFPSSPSSYSGLRPFPYPVSSHSRLSPSFIFC